MLMTMMIRPVEDDDFDDEGRQHAQLPRALKIYFNQNQ